MNHVLLVDDDHVINLELHAFLHDAGFEVEAAYSGLGAIAAIRRRPPWALVTDIDLGRGPDGFEVARIARIGRPCLPVVFVSGNKAHRHVVLDAQTSQFVGKPYAGQEVLEALRQGSLLAA